jgi:hypothetical protein
MGSFSEITFADYPVFCEKNCYSTEIVNLFFLPSDFICEKRKYSTKNILVWGDAYENKKGTFEFKGFRQTVKVCRERLEIFGASYKKSKRDFQQAKKISRQEGFYDFNLSSITYDQYLEEIKSIIDSKEKTFDHLNINLRESLTSNELGIYGLSLGSHLHSILSVLLDNDVIEYDLTDLIEGGWVKITEAKNVYFEKIIILTEGKTDVEFISNSIKKLYPHLKDYYHFIDFEEYKIESSASALVKLVSSFAAANVKHPIIVLFDNDTAGLKEMKKLASKALTPNIKILRYPDINLANKYPTIGPTGKKNMNVNSLACSIEMYFGVDVLTRNKELIPIQWKAFDDKERKYQGEISDKNYVQNTFRNKLKKTEVTEFKELNELLNVIFNAYK